MLEEARAVGLTYVELTAERGNAASHAVILANGGRLVDEFDEPPFMGGVRALRFRIHL